MIALALALATPAPPAPDRIDAQVAKMNEALAELEAERAAAAPPATPAPPPFEIKGEAPPAPSAKPRFAPDTDCAGPLCGQWTRPDAADLRSNLPPGDTRVTPQERLAELAPFAWALAAAGLAFALWRFLRPRWRAYVPIMRGIFSRYWREIGLFTMLSAIFLKLW